MKETQFQIWKELGPSIVSLFASCWNTAEKSLAPIFFSLFPSFSFYFTGGTYRRKPPYLAGTGRYMPECLTKRNQPSIVPVSLQNVKYRRVVKSLVEIGRFIAKSSCF